MVVPLCTGCAEFESARRLGRHQPSGMTHNKPAGGKPAQTNAQTDAQSPMAAAKVKVSSVAGFLAVVPHLLGFYPSRSMVVVGLDSRRGRITLAFRYDLPDPPDPARAREIARHATEVLEKRQIMTAIAAGYGPGVLVTPVAESIRAATRSARITCLKNYEKFRPQNIRRERENIPHERTH